ncbi:TIGR00730 family Rossman fold protein, partial [Elusimicrobiota bacterium]
MIRKHTHKKLMKIMDSPSYKMAYEDIDFLASDDLRPVRLQLELLKPEMILENHNIKATIVAFGSARIHSREDSLKQFKKIEKQLRKAPNNKKLIYELEKAKSLVTMSKYYNEARKLAYLISKKFGPKGISVVTGGGPGIMEAANRGAHDAGGKSIGLNITLPFEQYPNSYVTPDLCFQFRYFAIRKMHFLMRAKALIAFPGGFGTLDETFESLTLIQTQKIANFPVVLFGREFWENTVNFQYLVDSGVISAGDLSLFHFADTAQEALNIISK